VQFYTPEWQYSFGATYDVALGDKNSLRLNADYSHVSSFYMSPNRADRKLPGYGTLSLRASYLIGEHLDLSLYATNVTDKKYYAAGIISGNLAPATVGEPRMYGAELTYRF
jgi:iron complex outermembrane receptor protein